jgi:hypothetical protein
VRARGGSKNVEMLTIRKELLKCAGSVRFVSSATLKKEVPADDDQYLHSPVTLHLLNVLGCSIRRIRASFLKKTSETYMISGL